MKLTLNGESREIPDGLTVSGLLEHLDLARRMVAVEINREIVPRAMRGSTPLHEGDAVEIVQFVGGG